MTLEQKIEGLKKVIANPANKDEGKKRQMQEQIAKLEAKLQEENNKPSTPTSTPDKPSIESHLEKLQQFDKQEILPLKGADLKSYQQHRDEDESVMAIYTAARNSSRKAVQEAASFLKKEAAKKNSDEAELKKLLIRLNDLLKVEKESKPDCKSCKAQAGKKAISTKKRNGKATTYAECLAILEALPKAQQKKIVEELGVEPNGKPSSKTGNAEVPGKAKSKPAKPGSQKYTEKVVQDSLKSVKRIVKAKASKNPIEAYQGLCKLNTESELIKEAGGLVLLREAMKKLKTYSNGLVNNDFLTEFDKELKELLNHVTQLKKKAEL